ncbi:hypothetical protein [Halorussus lipolyticus]|uniref:hypothetical protein n=1 Tax=Halorussus lipolyticus TaxID=3034024 RepID=UPI0023E7BD4D|nr:hypothetical protein [Halorussus sp. DT80]
MELSLESAALGVLPLLALLVGYVVYRAARTTGTPSPFQRGVGTAVVLLLAFPAAFGLTALYLGSDWQYRALYFAPLVLLGVALSLFSAAKRPILDTAK